MKREKTKKNLIEESGIDERLEEQIHTQMKRVRGRTNLVEEIGSEILTLMIESKNKRSGDIKL